MQTPKDPIGLQCEPLEPIPSFRYDSHYIDHNIDLCSTPGGELFDVYTENDFWGQAVRGSDSGCHVAWGMC